MDKKMSATPEARVLYAAVPADLYFRVKYDALRRRLTLAQWVAEAARVLLDQTEEPPPTHGV
jgi:streptomycin 6-kinase